MYKLFTDKAETFECDIKIEGASLTNSKARLVIETKDYSLLFHGKINSSGKCTIPVKKLKGLIDESSKGDIRLEVIAEDTYFTPWESKFEIEASKKVETGKASDYKKTLTPSEQKRFVKLVCKVKGIETYSGQKTIDDDVTVTAEDVKLVIKEVLGVDLTVENINV